MDQRELLSESLAEEVLSDMAENFFGTRTQLERRIDRLYAHSRRLHQKAHRVTSAAGLLRCLLLDDAETRGLGDALGVAFDGFPADPAAAPPTPPPRWPFALTRRGVFTQLVVDAYADLHAVREEYMLGRYVPDPDVKGRMRVTVNYTSVHQFCDRLNVDIDRVNRQSSPSQMLQYIKRFDVLQEERANILGSGFDGKTAQIDQHMAFQKIDFDALGLPVFPALATVEKAREPIKKFCRGLYRRRPAEILRAMRTLKGDGHRA
ncbi:MAG: hypothetical protein WCD46_09060 [Desulfobacterales bacterium]